MKIFSAVFILVSSLYSFGQDIPMKPFEAMIGTWEGSGWYLDQKTMARHEFSQREVIKLELAGNAISIRGTGMRDTVVVHDALAFLSCDSSTSEYPFYSVLRDGRRTESKMKVLEAGRYEWRMEIPKGQIRYSISIEGNKWDEQGEYSPDGKSWYPFIAFSLSRKEQSGM